MKKAVGYIRVSTDAQAVEGISLDAQNSKIQSWCIASDYELIGVFVDAGISGKRADNRPELQKALAAVTSTKGALVVYSLSRLARSTTDTINISEQLRRAGADLVSLSERIDTTTAAGRMVFQMLAVLAEFERNQISERTTAAMAHMRNEGKFLGQVPFGFDLMADGETLRENPKELEVIHMMRKLRANGYSLRQIATELNLQSIRTKFGRTKWSHTTVKSVLSRKVSEVAPESLRHPVMT